MKSSLNRGSSDLTGILIIVFIIVVVILSPKDGSGNPSGWSLSPGVGISGSGGLSGSSSYQSTSGTGDVSIGSGNARYSYQSYEEYITLDNRSRNSIDITGWQLKNGKDKRPYYLGNTLQRFSADVATIPQATLVLSPSGYSIMQDVVLKSGERAIVTTGSVGNRYPYTITSFKENICTSYIEALPEYAFNPPLTQSCPRPSNEPGIEALDSSCRNFIQGIPSCQTPKIGGKDSKGDDCPGCVNGKLVSGVCKAFIEEHFSYQGCLAYHSSDPNFSGRTWRIFLGRGWEMWAEDYESIELFDRLGQLVNYQNY